MEIKIDQVETKVDSNTKIANELIVLLHKRLQQIEKQTTPPGVELFYHLEMKQKEIQTLKEQIWMLEAGYTPQPLSDEDLFQKQKKPTTYEIYQLIKKQEAEKKREREKKGKGVQDDDPSSKISKAMMIQKGNHQNPLSSLLKDYGETMIPKIATSEDQVTESSISFESESSEDSYDSSDDRIMATNQPEVKEEYAEDEPMETTTSSTNQPPIPNTGAKYNFTIEDIPVAKWAQRFQEFHSWMETQKLTRESHYDILAEFVSRFTGVLRDWWETVSPGDQMQFLVQQDFSTIIRILHTHFLGNQEDVRILQRKEFFKRKCCSFEKKDLEKHYKAMIKLFYALGADQSLKQVIMSSIPELLQNAVD
ncbi:hypothetical protein V6N12_043024 [Hibiscus sabdariffa]|uniref:Polyprotein n=1 Tax=Hibiscus sabdariffa TaxID=183260 RepID=A0ABR2DI12_9ROSI